MQKDNSKNIQQTNVDKINQQSEFNSHTQINKKLSIWKKITFAFIVLAIFLLSLEIAARLFGAKPFPNIPYADADYEVEWELKKNFDDDSWLKRQNPDGSITPIRIKTNSFGLRDEEFQINKLENEYRILFLGDSVVFGFKLNAEETISFNLQQQLRNELSLNNINVINCGVDGYSTFQEYYFLKNRGLKLSPDMVLLGFVLNDVFEPHLTTKARGGSGNYAGLAGRKSIGRTFIRYACNSAFFTKMFFSYLEIKNKSRSSKHSADGRKYRTNDDIYNTANLFTETLSKEIEEAWNEIESDILELKKLTDENNIAFIIVIFPYAGQVVEKVWSLKPQERLVQFLSKNNIPYVDLADAFIEHPNPITLFLEGDGNHLSPIGSEYCSKIIADEIKSLIKKNNN